MDADEIYIRNIFTQFFGHQPRNIADIEGVQQAFAFYLRNAGYSGYIVKFIHNHRIHDEAGNAKIFGDSIGYEGTQV